MEEQRETVENCESHNRGLQIIRYAPFQLGSKSSSSWFELKVFYVRISNFAVDESTPESFTLNHIPLSPDTLLEVNGVRSSMYTDGASLILRRDRMDKKSEEATFVSTDSIRLTGSVKFEVYDKEDLILSGNLDLIGSNGYVGEAKSEMRRWNMNCEAEITVGSGFLKGRHLVGPDLPPLPSIEVYVAGCFSGKPIILTKTLQLNFRKKQNKKAALDVIPENETDDSLKDGQAKIDSQGMDYVHYKQEYEEEYNSMYMREYMDLEDGELSWFNAGVRVGVGIGLGVCVGIGIGVGLLVRTYQATTRGFRRRLL